MTITTTIITEMCRWAASWAQSLLPSQSSSLTLPVEFSVGLYLRLYRFSFIIMLSWLSVLLMKTIPSLFSSVIIISNHEHQRLLLYLFSCKMEYQHEFGLRRKDFTAALTCWPWHACLQPPVFSRLLLQSHYDFGCQHFPWASLSGQSVLELHPLLFSQLYWM